MTFEINVLFKMLSVAIGGNPKAQSADADFLILSRLF